ncbi:MAG: hypothetical protein PVG39_02955 [Desulfobacteraceae bacterium]|jgi:hypothetical protein
MTDKVLKGSEAHIHQIGVIGKDLDKTVYLSWRFVFFINVPIAFFATLPGYRVIPGGTGKPEQRLDIAGAVLGGGLFQSPMNSAAMGSAPNQFRGVASSILVMMRNVGMVFGIAIAGTIVYNIASFTTQGHAGLFSPGQPGIFLKGLKWAFIAASGVVILSAVSALFARADK